MRGRERPTICPTESIVLIVRQEGRNGEEGREREGERKRGRGRVWRKRGRKGVRGRERPTICPTASVIRVRGDERKEAQWRAGTFWSRRCRARR